MGFDMKLGLALGGGGARGAAHIGVLIELMRLGIKPDLVTGTSVGGMIGALLAAGVELEDMVEFFPRLNVSHMYSLPDDVPSIAGHKNIEHLLEETIGRITFDDLRIPLSVVTTDLISRKEVVIDEGDLISAILATISIPILLPPVERGGHMLIDGGVVNNTPFDIARARGCTYVLAIDLTNTAVYGTPTDFEPIAINPLSKILSGTKLASMWQVVSTMMDIISRSSMNTRLAIIQPDLLLRPKLGTIGILDFHRWKDAIEAGREAVRGAEKELLEFKEKAGLD